MLDLGPMYATDRQTNDRRTDGRTDGRTDDGQTSETSDGRLMSDVGRTSYDIIIIVIVVVVIRIE